MKKIVILLVAILSLTVSCIKQSGVKSEETITVRLVTDKTGVDDGAFNASAWEGILDFYGETWNRQLSRGTLFDVIPCLTEAEYIPNLDKMSESNVDLIVTTGFSFADAMETTAAKYPNQKYFIVDTDWLTQPNIMQASFAEHEGSYLVGKAIALKAVEGGYSSVPTFGFIGGETSSTIEKFEVGYIHGIWSQIPNAIIEVYYAEDWGRPDLAKAKAKEWFDNGVFAIYSAAGGTGLGTIAQAREYRLQGKNVWAIGVDADQYEEGLYNQTDSAVFTSMLKRVDVSLIYALNSIKNNSFVGDTILFDLSNDGVGYSTRNSALTQEIARRLEAEKRLIINGEIKVASKYTDLAILFPGR